MELKIKLKVLDIGANDYLAKPFSFAELLARIRVQLRTSNLIQTKNFNSWFRIDLLNKTAIRVKWKYSFNSKRVYTIWISYKNRIEF